MITSRQDRHKFIGGSDSKYVDMNYETATFKKWWKDKILARTPNHFTNYSMDLGTMLEHEISKAAGFHSLDAVKYKEGTIARVNLDGLLGDDTVGESKTSNAPQVLKWLESKSRNTASAYRSQVRHAMYVTDRRRAAIAVLPLTKFDYDNPLKIVVNPLKLVWFNYTWDDFDMNLYDRKIRYLTYCYKNYLIPQNEGWNLQF